MSDSDQTYDPARAERLKEMLRALARRILELDASGRLLAPDGGLQHLLGDVRSELFHYEVRCTYDTPEIAEHRRLVDEARRAPSFLDDDPENDEPWQPPRPPA